MFEIIVLALLAVIALWVRSIALRLDEVRRIATGEIYE
jgi:hypothetical protein